MAADTVEAILASQSAPFSWQILVDGHPPPARDLLRFIEVQPKLDFGALEPGRAATDTIKQLTGDLSLAADYGARVRLTGLIPMDDDEFATVRMPG